LYQESESDNKAKLKTIRNIDTHTNETSFSSIDIEKGAQRLFISEKEIVFIYPTMLKIYKNVKGYPFLETDIPFESDIDNLVFIPTDNKNNTAIAKLVNHGYILLQELEIKKPSMLCKKKPNSGFGPFDFELRLEYCPCNAHSQNAGSMLECCYVYQPIHVKFHQDLVGQLELGFLFGIIIGCGVVFVLHLVGAYWVENHPDSLLFLTGPPPNMNEADEHTPLTATHNKEKKSRDSSPNKASGEEKPDFEMISIDDILLN